MASPRIVEIAGEASVVLRGKASVGAYWERALRFIPDLRFEKARRLRRRPQFRDPLPQPSRTTGGGGVRDRRDWTSRPRCRPLRLKIICVPDFPDFVKG